MSNGKKISDEQFLSILRENAGLFAMTAKAISDQFGIEYSRQAVRKRATAKKFKAELEDIRQEVLDIAEDGLQTLMKSPKESIKLRAIEIFLKTKGKERGYSERHEITGAGGEQIVGVVVK